MKSAELDVKKQQFFEAVQAHVQTGVLHKSTAKTIKPAYEKLASIALGQGIRSEHMDRLQESLLNAVVVAHGDGISSGAHLWSRYPRTFKTMERISNQHLGHVQDALSSTVIELNMGTSVGKLVRPIITDAFNQQFSASRKLGRNPFRARAFLVKQRNANAAFLKEQKARGLEERRRR